MKKSYSTANPNFSNPVKSIGLSKYSGPPKEKIKIKEASIKKCTVNSSTHSPNQNKQKPFHRPGGKGKYIFTRKALGKSIFRRL